MCGQLGILYGQHKREPEDQSYLKWLFIYLLLLSERRGPFATGLAWLKTDGSHCIFKRTKRAVEFVKMNQFLDAIAGVDDNTTWLAGHTRWPTRGAVDVVANAQPLRAGRIIGTVNGTILNADILFARFNLQRFAEVDSEVVFRMADDMLHDGRIDISALKERLALCKGPMSAVLASKLDPNNMIVIKGNKPLELRYHPGHKAIIYASDPHYLDLALTRETGWDEIQTKPMTIMTFHCDDLPRFESVSFELARHGFQRHIEPQKGKTD